MKSHQRLIREKAGRDDAYAHAIPDLKECTIERVNYAEAKPFILQYEWLGRMSPTKYHYGLYHLFDCAAMVCIGGQNCTGASYTHKMLGVEQHQVGILARGASAYWAPKNAGSFLIASACSRLKEDSPYRVVIAYADERAGEIGTLYQSCNWTYIGLGSPSFRMESPDATRSFNSASIIVEAQKLNVKWSVVYQRYLAEGWKKIKEPGKHRYVHVLHRSDRNLKKSIDSMSKPYPKRSA